MASAAYVVGRQYAMYLNHTGMASSGQITPEKSQISQMQSSSFLFA